MENALKIIFADRFKTAEPLAGYTTFRVGGPARWLVEANSTDEVVEAVHLVEAYGADFAFLGGGTNLLPPDSGFDGLIIKLANRDFKIDGDRVIAEAGALTTVVARSVAKEGLAGFEWAATVPGTIGGAVFGNAGCFGGEMKDVVESVTVLRGGESVELTNQDLGFGYRSSALKGSNDVILNVTLALTPGKRQEIEAKINEIVSKRQESQPLGASCAGCTFKNFEFEDDSKIEKLRSVVSDIPEPMIESKTIAAGWLIDQVGLKGHAIGGASVSTEHGNFIVNDGTATADQIIQLISFIKMKVRDELGIQLTEEIQYLLNS